MAGIMLAGKWSTWVVRPVLSRPEIRFEVRVGVGDPWPGEGSVHAKFFQAALERGGTHGIAVVGMEDERLLSAFAVGGAFCSAVTLPEASPAH